MTTANVAQTIEEAVAANPSPAAKAAQSMAETVAANAAVPTHVAQLFFELVASTALVAPAPSAVFRPPPELVDREEEALAWARGLQSARFASAGIITTVVISPRRAAAPIEAAIEDRLVWQTNNFRAFAAVPRPSVSLWVNT